MIAEHHRTGDDRGLAANTSNHFTFVEVLNRNTVHVVGVRPTDRVVGRFPKRFAELQDVAVETALLFEGCRNQARAVIGLGREVRRRLFVLGDVGLPELLVGSALIVRTQ